MSRCEKQGFYSRRTHQGHFLESDVDLFGDLSNKNTLSRIGEIPGSVGSFESRLANSAENVAILL